MADPKLPVIYAMLLPDNSGFVDYNSVREKLDEHSFPDFPVVEYVPKSNAAPPPESPPREYWRLLEVGEMQLPTDDMWTTHSERWIPLSELGCSGPELCTGNYPIRRRVSPPPTCATCSCFYMSNCTHPDGPSNVPGDGSGYCHLHPQVQEANRG